MNSNKVLLSTLAGGVAYFFLGWLVYGLLLKDVFTQHAELAKEPMELWAMALSCLLYGLLFAVIYGRWAGISTFKTGAIAGAVIGLLFSAVIDLSMFSMYNFITLSDSVIDMVVNAVLSAIVGGVVGWVLGYGKSE